jgi:large subunit ribosomal protein L24e
MVKCTFCGEEIPTGTGKMYVKVDGNIFYFCTKKCEKNQIKLGRNPRFLKWTNKYEKGEKL